MITFDAAHQAVHYPADRRFRIWIRPSLLLVVGGVGLILIAAPWVQFALAGLPGSFSKFLLPATAGPQRTFHSDGSSAPVLQRSLHAGE